MRQRTDHAEVFRESTRIVDGRSGRQYGATLTPGERPTPGGAFVARRGKQMKRLLVVAATAAVLVGSTAGGALAGEVKGPPGQLDNTNETGAPANANSNCAFSGLNDFDSQDPVGQNASQVQTAADSWKYYGLPHGAPGTLGLCKGGTNEDRAK